MSIITRILAPTDFSDCAQHAYDYATALAREHRAALVIEHAYMMPVLSTPDGTIEPPSADVAEARARLEESLHRLELQARERGVRSVDTVLREGSAWRAIVDVARERGCDLIVIGSHGRSGVSHFLVGSVVEKVVRKAHCAVMAVKSPTASAQATAAVDAAR